MAISAPMVSRKNAPRKPSNRFCVKGCSHFLNVGPMTANGLMQLIARDAKFLGPVGDIGCYLRVDFLRIMRSFDRLFFDGMGLVRLRCVVVL